MLKKMCYILLLFWGQLCIACVELDSKSIALYIENSFQKKSFESLIQQGLIDSSTAITVENDSVDIGEDERITVFRFKNVGGLLRWFDDNYQSSTSMIVLENLQCTHLKCNYELPKNTLHHGVYLGGYSTKEKSGCLLLSNIYIFEG